MPFVKTLDYKVSVYVVSCNRARKLFRCLSSILNQSHPSFEVIVVDNGSSDDSLRVLESFSRKNVNLRYYALSKNMGACFARNLAIKLAWGEYVTGVDDDDEWLPGRLSGLHSAYSEKLAFVYSDDVFVFSDGSRKPTARPEVVTLSSIRYQNDVGNQVFSSLEKFKNVGFFDESLTSAQDYDMWLRMVEKYGQAEKAKCAGQYIHVGGDDRITAYPEKKFGYLAFYRKHKERLTLNQRRHQLLMIKYMCQRSISIRMYFKLFSFVKIKRKISVFFKRVVFKLTYPY
ncbi:glycosyltransferase [Microbulbifer sp. ZKSA006]|uniref:glycosyltransferase n=1 Tax=Microbulbifer sp. ZKSA006 TaxID=3243390 RepID=UPI00403910DA